MRGEFSDSTTRTEGRSRDGMSYRFYNNIFLFPLITFELTKNLNSLYKIV